MSTDSNIPDLPPSSEDFCRFIVRSGLLSRAELELHLRTLPKEAQEDSKQIAESLINAQKLTPFQVNKLLRGTFKGLTVGAYHILAPLGRGGMGTVYLARDTRQPRLVALKILPPKVAAEEERMLARFRREMEMSQRMIHRHVALTLEVGQANGVHFIAMEYIPGRTLARLVNEDGPLAMPRAARLMAEVSSGLHHAHEQGIIHRDLKPSNILITPKDHAKILDLGLALMRGEVIEDVRVVGGEGYIVGTTDYIAPEQTLNSANVDPRSDLYSLGCTLYFALSGQTPFPGKGNSREKYRRHREEEPIPIWNLVPLPGDFARLVMRLLEKDPARRPENASEVERQLRLWGGESEWSLDVAENSETEIQRVTATVPEVGTVNLPEAETRDEVEIVKLRSSEWDLLWPALVVLGAAFTVIMGIVIAIVILFSRR
jgi:serine/threonine protein kinase